MRSILNYIYIAVALFMVAACANETSEDETSIQLEGIIAELGERGADETTSRAINDFAVNTSADPTHESTRLTGGFNWTLSVNIHDRNGADYPPGNALCTYEGSAWIPQSDLFFPNYKSPHVIANLYPPGWILGQTQIAQDQGTAENLRNQDLLVQNGAIYQIRPSHRPTIVLRHGNSMLNFILSGVTIADITTIDVVSGGLTYEPYPVPGRTNPEYMLILPVGTTNPVVRITTNSGARYQETINLNSTSGMAINTCYCVKLIGVELVLSSVTVIDWVYGTALAGSYTTVTSYPTFRGPANTTVTLYFDNGLQQSISFNQDGEATVKPSGRVIVQINDEPLETPLILDRMYVDLRDYIS